MSDIVCTNFKNFVEGINKYDGHSECLNAYTNTLILNKYDEQFIKQKRMEWFIDMFCTNKYNKKDYELYYKNYITDRYNNNLIDFKNIKKIIHPEEEDQDEDTKLHYRDYFNRHLKYSSPENDNEIDELYDYYSDDEESLPYDEYYTEYSSYEYDEEEYSDYDEYSD